MSEPTKPPSVIIADNNEFYRRVLGDFYREQGFDVRVACDGIETLEMVRARRPDLLVLDLIMPRLDGARLSSFLKGQDAWRDIPIIILSGILADEIDGVEEIRAEAYFAKMPLDQIREALGEVSARLMAGGSGPGPILSGFEKMSRREVVLELLAERRTSQAMLDSLSEGIAEVSRDRRLLSSNRAFAEMIGASAGDLLARPLEDAFPEDGPAIRALFEDLQRGRPAAVSTIRLRDREVRLRLRRLDPVRALPDDGPPAAMAPGGGVREAVKRAARTTAKVRLEATNGQVGYTLLAEDITQRARAERERELLRERLAQSEKMSAIGLFVAGAAHELNNPLTSVLGFAQLLEQKHRDAGLAADLRKIAAGAGRCKTILESLMAFARSHRPAKVPVDLDALLRESVDGCADRLGAAGIEVTLDLANDLPPMPADPLQILQAFNGIIDNAVKAVGSIAGRRSLTIRSRAAQGRIVIEFSDSGPGIPQDVLGKVFEPFVTTRPIGQGPGLGLSAAYGMVRAHAGRIRAGNRPEGGAVVTLEFPIAAGDVGRAEPPASIATAGTPPGGEPRRILIVDDETVVQELLVDLLDSPANRIDTASNGREGLRKIEQNAFDLVILDLRMPDMTGQQVYDALTRRRPDMLDRLLFITADTVTPEVESFLESVGSPCLRKPFAVDAVVEQVESLLRGERR